jgi:hypothetical protein
MALRQLFDTWRSIRLPWRREVLVGIDSKGNEYYESLWKRESECEYLIILFQLLIKMI